MPPIDANGVGYMNSPATASMLVACHDCGLLYRLSPLAPGSTAKCARCGAVLAKAKQSSIERTLVLNLAGLVLFVLANVYPFMTFKIQGREQVNTLFSGVWELFQNGMWMLSALVLATSILVPLIKILSMLYVLIPLQLGRRLPRAETVFRYTEIMHPWAMMEVYLLGVFVAIVNLSGLGAIELGIAVYSFAALIVILVAAEATLDPQEVWVRFAPTASTSGDGPENLRSLIGCHSCQQINRVVGSPASAHANCSRCGASLHRRTPNSISTTWALVVAAAILYIPANVFPVMTVISFGKGQPDTILSGVKHLIEGGLWPLAALVFFASIAVPILKLSGLGFLLISTQCKSKWRMKDRTVLYRVVEAVGRWSMIDIFMVSILVALVKLGSIATIEPGTGATSFAAVVIITMIAAHTFDVRLIWDAAGREGEESERPRI